MRSITASLTVKWEGAGSLPLLPTMADLQLLALLSKASGILFYKHLRSP